VSPPIFRRSLATVTNKSLTRLAPTKESQVDTHKSVLCGDLVENAKLVMVLYTAKWCIIVKNLTKPAFEEMRTGILAVLNQFQSWLAFSYRNTNFN
jgi:thiol:disulfide interchange protein